MSGSISQLMAALEWLSKDAGMDGPGGSAQDAAHHRRVITMIDVLNTAIQDGGVFCWAACDIVGPASTCAASETVVYTCTGCIQANHTCPSGKDISCANCDSLEPPPPPNPSPPPPPNPSPPPQPPLMPPPILNDIAIITIVGILIVALVAAAALWCDLRGRRNKSPAPDAPSGAAPPVTVAAAPQRHGRAPVPLEMVGAVSIAGPGAAAA